ncbi:MAG TPA: winged helix-turn-helix transcriptional regulator [Propionicimonas sp.]|nr:winged helix-turn-helix transcriptional regulator [Propionicimonas sp.]
MKPSTFSFVLTADQVGSRSADDGVPAALAALGDLAVTLAFERTAGDEIQGLLDDPRAVVMAVTRLTRLGGWRIGLGAGAVDSPVPTSTRAARGPAYLAARAAIDTARTAPAELALALPKGVSGDADGEVNDAAQDAEAALWLLRTVLARRSEEGWELMDLLEAGLTNARAAERLGISPSAVSQRLARALRTEVDRGSLLAGRLLGRLQQLAVAP